MVIEDHPLDTTENNCTLGNRIVKVSLSSLVSDNTIELTNLVIIPNINVILCCQQIVISLEIHQNIVYMDPVPLFSPGNVGVGNIYIAIP